MFWPILSLVLLLTDSNPHARPTVPRPARLQLLAAEVGDDSAYDPQAEKELLDLTNRTRERAGLPLFQLDEGLARAAHKHATTMAMRQELSHQFPGELGLSQRISADSKLYLIEVAENVALAESAERINDGLMHSPPHRENILHPSYNSIGIGIVRRGNVLYAVEDFGHSLPTYSSEKAEDVVAEAIAQKRAGFHQGILQRNDGTLAQKMPASWALLIP